MNDKAGSKQLWSKGRSGIIYYIKESDTNNPLVEIIDVDAHITEEAFAISAAKKLIALMEMKKNEMRI